MNNTADNTKQYDLPQSSTQDKDTLENLRRGLCQEADGLRQQLQGKHQQIRAIDKALGRER